MYAGCASIRFHLLFRYLHRYIGETFPTEVSTSVPQYLSTVPISAAFTSVKLSPTATRTACVVHTSMFLMGNYLVNPISVLLFSSTISVYYFHLLFLPIYLLLLLPLPIYLPPIYYLLLHFVTSYLSPCPK